MKRLIKEDVERMVNDAEKYRNEDEEQQATILVKNALESYCFKIKSTMEKCNEVISWLEANQLADKEEYEHKLKELKNIFNSIRCRRKEGIPGLPGAGTTLATGGGDSAGTTIEEVDYIIP